MPHVSAKHCSQKMFCRRNWNRLVLLTLIGILIYYAVSQFYSNERNPLGTDNVHSIASRKPEHSHALSSQSNPDILKNQHTRNEAQNLTFNTLPTQILPPKQPRQFETPDDWPQFFVPRKQPQFSLDFPYKYDASNSSCWKKKVDLVTMTLSLPGNFEERQSIRDTWGSLVDHMTWPDESGWQRLPMSVGRVFLIGDVENKPGHELMLEKLRLESQKYGDVVQWKGLRDTYFNLTMKVILGLKWVTNFCPDLKFLMKTDDDTFVHMQRLTQQLSRAKDLASIIWGPFFHTASCHRGGKYAVSKEAYPFRAYPPHVKGNIYIIPGNAVSKMAAVAAYLPYNNMEDAHVTGTLARTLGLKHHGLKRTEFLTFPGKISPCLFKDSKTALASQKVTPHMALQIWETFLGARQCPHKN